MRGVATQYRHQSRYNCDAQVNLYLTDIKMSGMNGIDLIRALPELAKMFGHCLLAAYRNIADPDKANRNADESKRIAQMRRGCNSAATVGRKMRSENKGRERPTGMCPPPCAIPESSSGKFRRWPPNSQDVILAHSAAQKRSDTLIAPCKSGTARGPLLSIVLCSAPKY